MHLKPYSAAKLHEECWAEELEGVVRVPRWPSNIRYLKYTSNDVSNHLRLYIYTYAHTYTYVCIHISSFASSYLHGMKYQLDYALHVSAMELRNLQGLLDPNLPCTHLKHSFYQPFTCSPTWRSRASCRQTYRFPN